LSRLDLYIGTRSLLKLPYTDPDLILHLTTKMHSSLTLLPFFLLSVHVLADGASILAAMSLITNNTIALNNTVTAFPSNPLLALGDVAPLLVDSVALLNDINEGTGVAQNSANLTTAEVIGVAQATISLAGTVESTLGNIVASKPKFDKLVSVCFSVFRLEEGGGRREEVDGLG
jgi:hypothetical protein